MLGHTAELVLEDALDAQLVQHMPSHLDQLHVQLVMYAPLVTFKHLLVPQPATGSVNNVKRVQPINTRQDVLEPVITHAIHAHHV